MSVADRPVVTMGYSLGMFSSIIPAMRCVSGPVLVMIALAGCAGGQASSKEPEPTTGDTLESQHAFQRLESAWETGSVAEKRALRVELSKFRRRFPNDPLATKAAAYEALIAVMGRKYARALSLAQVPLRGPAGNTRDIALIVRALVDVGVGNKQEGYRALRQLTEKLLDRFALRRALRGLAEVALELHRWDEALDAMGRWLTLVPQRDVPGVIRQIGGWLDRIPTAQLRQMVRLHKRSGEESVWSDSFQHIVERHLRASVTHENPDTPSQAAQGATNAHEGRTTAAGNGYDGSPIALLVEETTSVTRRRSTQALAGWLSVVGTRETKEQFSVRTVLGGPNEIVRACRSMAKRGARIEIGGMSQQSAQALARCARQQPHLVVVLFVRPKNVPNNPRIFVLGEPEQVALDSRAGKEAIAQVGEKQVEHVLEATLTGKGEATWSCDQRDPISGPPVGAWVKAGKRGIAIDATADCASDILDSLAGHRRTRGVRVWVGLEGSSRLRVPSKLSGMVWAAHVGQIGRAPVRQGKDRALTAWYASRGQPPTWFEGLGHDAAALVLASTTRAEERGTWPVGLDRSVATLWTSAKRGFAGKQTLERHVTFVQANMSVR